jgi:hypothetical protein
VLPQISASLLPALLTAGGALSGVVLTLVIQAINSTTQRRNERRGRAFEARFELYADFWNCVEGMPDLRTRANQYIAKQTAVAEAVDAQRRQNEELAAVVSGIPSSGDLTELSVEQRQDFQQRAKATAAKSKEIEGRLAKAKIALDVAGKSRDVRSELDEAHRQVFRVRQKMKILSDQETLVAATAIFERVARAEEPTSAEQSEFRDAARRELGLDRRWWPARTWSWIRRQGRYWKKKIAKKRRQA